VYAVYSGDSLNLGSTSACEPLTVTGITHGAPQFPMGMLPLIGLALPALLLLRRYKGVQPNHLVTM